MVIVSFDGTGTLGSATARPRPDSGPECRDHLGIAKSPGPHAMCITKKRKSPIFHPATGFWLTSSSGVGLLYLPVGMCVCVFCIPVV